jgi:uroporphyrinogen-III synthase
VTIGALAGRRVVVTRAVAQAQPLIDSIEELGGVAIALPLLEIRDAADGGAALRHELAVLRGEDWLVVLSPNGAQRIVDHLAPNSCRLAVLASGTASVFEAKGWVVDLTAELASSEGLLDAFSGVEVEGRVVIAQAEHGRPLLSDGLRREGVEVRVVQAYRNLSPNVDSSAVDAARDADTVVFASPSAVARYVDTVGVKPSGAVCIGAVTADAARAAGFEVVAAATPTLDALTSALAFGDAAP